MNKKHRHSSLLSSSVLLSLVILVCAAPALGLAAGAPHPSFQTPDLVYQEAQTVYLGNLARQQNGVPPLRWNLQLTNAARWFAWDSVENRPDPYCGHQDTLGGWPGDRAHTFAYWGNSGAENAFCGYVTPQQAIDGWMNSPGHRDNLLDPGSREIGLGYYQRPGDGRGYVVQDFGQDPVYPPVVIENEALNVTDTAVNLYIYDRVSGGGFAGMGPATQMRISNSPCFTGANWETYQAQKPWQLASGQGWRSVFVQTIDRMNRTVTVSDTIYLGRDLPLAELGDAQMSTNRPQVTLYGLEGGGLPQMQFSPNWFADDAFETFTLWWGNGERLNDPTAWGGSAFRLFPGNGESFAWVWTTDFLKNTPLVAYFRLKVNDNSSAGEVARISVKGGGVDYGPLSLKGIDFTAANAYQEFAIPFVFHESDDAFLMFNFWRSGGADVYVDAVSIFTAPQPLSSPYTWDVPGGNYRGQSLWVRYTDGASQFSEMTAANLHPGGIDAQPAVLSFMTALNGLPPGPKTISVAPLGCTATTWQVSSNAGWLLPQGIGDAIQVSVDPAGLSLGVHQGMLTVDPAEGADVLVPVTLLVVEEIHPVYLPLVVRGP